MEEQVGLSDDPRGFEGALILGDYGFGSVVVDEHGDRSSCRCTWFQYRIDH